MPARFLFLVLLTGSVLVAGCGGSTPIEPKFKASEDVKKLPPEIQTQIANALTKYFGTPSSPIAHPDSGLSPERVHRGPALYKYNCVHCHGTTGDGAGPTAPFLNPLPRDFRRGVFKFTSTEPNVRPTREDLIRILKNGVNYTAMPSFVLLPDDQIEALVDYVMLLAMRGRLEGLLVAYYEDEPLEEETIQEQAEKVFAEWKEASSKVVTPGEKPPFTPESVARGKDLYLQGAAQCVSCHGAEGKGAAVKDQRDDWGNSIQAADLTSGVYRGGGRPIDLYRRIHSGIKGTPMPRFGRLNENEQEKLSNEQVWDLVHFVQSLNKNRM